MHTHKRRYYHLYSVAVLLGLCWLVNATIKHPHIQSTNSSSNSAKGMISLTAPDPIEHHRISNAYGKLPLSFEANNGQTDSSVKFISRGNGYNLLLTSSETVLTLRAQQANERDAIVRMQMIGANDSSVVTGVSELVGKSNYFIGNNSANWHENISHFAKVKYENIGSLIFGVKATKYSSIEKK